MTLIPLRKPLFRGAAAAAAVVAAVALAGPAWAYQEFQINMDNCNADNQSGDACVYTTVANNTSGLVVQFVSSPDMCSDIIVHISANWGSDSAMHELPLVGPGGGDRVSPGHGGQQYSIPKPANGGNTSTISVHANGIEGGCNTGGLLMWSGTLIAENTGYALPPKS
jgi:hypothetical protein